MRSTFSPRTLATLALTLVVIAGIGISALRLMNDMNRRTKQIINQNFQELTVESNTRAALNEYRQLQLRHIVESSPAAMRRTEVQLVENERTVQEGLDGYRKIAPRQDEREGADRHLATWRRYLEESDPAVVLSQTNQDDQAAAVLLTRARASFETLLAGLTDLQAGEKTEAEATFASGQREFTAARTAFTVALLASIAITACLGLWLLVIGPLRRSSASESYRRRLQRALDMADTEEEALDTMGRSLRHACSGLPVELLLADSSQAHLERALVAYPDNVPGCPVDAPRACEAVRSGQTRVFASSEDIDACPKLRGRPNGPCSAVCSPVTVLGRTIGVLHAVGPVGKPPRAGVRDALETTGTQTGSRLGVVRAMGQSQLQASTDPLTGLLNRRSLEERVQDLRRARVPYVVAMADLDHFKLLNDAHGHETGDRALRLFTRTMEEAVRTQDTVARYGGEEFVIVFPRCSTGEAAEAMARVRAALKEALANADVPEFTFSVGLAEAGPDESLHDALRAADEALMGAKRSGRDRVLIASSVRTEEGEADLTL